MKNHYPRHILKILSVFYFILFNIDYDCSAFDSPNVVFVITDDQGYGDLGCHGNPVLETPNIDKLYTESVRLTDYHVSPTCAPTRGALMSGHFTNRAGPWHTILGRSFLKTGQTTLAEVFKANGYSTGLFGKWHLGDNYPFRPEDRGFERVVSHLGGGVGQTPDYWNNSYFDDTYMSNGTPKKYKGYCTDVFFREAKGFIKQSVKLGKPFFAYISTNAPHGPMHCPDSYWKPYLKKGMNSHVAVFYGMIANIDENVGNLRTWLDKEGLAENTIFIFTTDNGTASGHKVFNAGMRGKKVSEYEGGHRVPFFIHWPEGNLSKGSDIHQITAHIDVLPTLIDLCNINGPQSYRYDGESLKPLLNDPDSAWTNRILITDNQRVLEPVKWKNCSVMDNNWRLINGVELYEIKKDPGQNNDVSSKHPELVERMRSAYEDWWASMEDSFSETARIIVGHDNENPSHLTAHDWMMAEANVAWHQSHIRKGVGNLGYWSLDVAKTGTYKIAISRYPREANAAINESITSGDPVPGLVAYRETPGCGLDVNQAVIEINGISLVQKINGDEKEIVFEVNLDQGELNLASRFMNAGGDSFCAYYAYVERI